MMQEDMETQLHTINLFVGGILADMKTVTKSTIKLDMLAHIAYWKNELQTIKHIIDI